MTLIERQSLDDHARPAKIRAMKTPASKPAPAARRSARPPKTAVVPFAKLEPDRRRLAQAQLAYLFSEELGYWQYDLAAHVAAQAKGRPEPEIKRQARLVRRLLRKIDKLSLLVPVAKEEPRSGARRARDARRIFRHLERRYLLRARLGLELDTLATWLDDDAIAAIGSIEAFEAMAGDWHTGLFAGVRDVIATKDPDPS
jgi:hypothetical protein